MTASVGAVAIGRNEGERLRICLASLQREALTMVYVDSGSSDHSLEIARAHGAEIVELDPARPFTAARARNEGFARLTALHPDLEFVQFIDGDCELQKGWVCKALGTFEQQSSVAVVTGRLRERFPHVTAFNRLCDLEWDGPIGLVESCGGVFMARAADFSIVRGFNESLIAGEEPDLCFRLRSTGRKIVRTHEEMALHDAAMTHPAQWWRRAKRSGYADAEASHLRGKAERHLRRKVASNMLWALPMAWPAWPLLWLRVRSRRGGLYATHIVLGKIPHAVGMVAYWTRSMLGSVPKIIEHR